MTGILSDAEKSTSFSLAGSTVTPAGTVIFGASFFRSVSLFCIRTVIVCFSSSIVTLASFTSKAVIFRFVFSVSDSFVSDSFFSDCFVSDSFVSDCFVSDSFSDSVDFASFAFASAFVSGCFCSAAFVSG